MSYNTKYNTKSPELHTAIENQNLERVKELLQKGVVVNDYNQWGIHSLTSACGTGNIEMIKLLVEYGADVNAQDLNNGQTPVMIAALQGEKAVKVLLDAGADVRIKTVGGQSALSYAISHPEALRMLLNAGAALDENGNIDHLILDKAYIDAATYGSKDSIKTLLDAGANVNAKDIYGGNALFAPVLRGDVESVKFLVEAGIDVNVQNQFGNTPLLYTAYNAQNQYDCHHLTIHSTASLADNLEIAQLLINAGADVNAQNMDGLTFVLEDLLRAPTNQELMESCYNTEYID